MATTKRTVEVALATPGIGPDGRPRHTQLFADDAGTVMTAEAGLENPLASDTEQDLGGHHMLLNTTIQPVMVYTLQSISLIYQFFLHTETVGRLGPLEWLLNTPSHHRVHHGRNPEYIDRNYGGILVVWDRLFGTFEPERAKVDYGLTHNVGSFNPLVIAFHYFAQMAREIRAVPTLRNARLVLFGPPEWSPEPTSETTPAANHVSATAP